MSNNLKFWGIASIAALSFVMMSGLQAMAYAPEGDLMKIKGYSPEVIQTADMQRSRQEWREPSPPRHTPMEKFFHNVYYGHWTGGVDEFGNGVMRDN